MAKAEKINVAPSVRLEMTTEEAEALVKVLQRVAGCPTSTRRGAINSVLGALRNVVQDQYYMKDTEGTIYFLPRN